MEALDHGYMITRLPCYGNPKKTSIRPGQKTHPPDIKPGDDLKDTPA
jgi:hypothetical protein